MSQKKLKVRVAQWPDIQCVSILPDEVDPHAHNAWEKVKDDLINEAKFSYVGSIGVLAFAELTDKFSSDIGEVHLNHDADLGDLYITSTTPEALSTIVAFFAGSQDYDVELVDAPNHSFNGTPGGAR